MISVKEGAQYSLAPGVENPSMPILRGDAYLLLTTYANLLAYSPVKRGTGDHRSFLDFYF